MAGPSDPMLLAKRCHKLLKGMEGALEGTLVITADKIKWSPDHASPTVKAVTLEISSVIKQQQAPGKPLLRILVTSGEPLALSFQSESDKNEVLDLLKQLVSARAGAAGPHSTQLSGVPDASEKRRRFAADKDLEVLYNQLVVNGGLLSEADFWKARDSFSSFSTSTSIFGLAKNANSNATTTTTSEHTNRQRSGLSSVMHEVQRLHDGSTERVSIQLTPRDIQQIFLERQEVHRAYLAHVPHSMNEKEFWKRYFKMEYKKAAKRKRLAAAGRFNVSEEELEDPDDIFAPFKRQILEEEAATAKRKVGYVDPTVNLVAEFGEKWTSPLFGGGLGWAHTGSEDGASASTFLVNSNGNFQETARTTASAARGQRVQDSIAHDVNRHAAQVLDGTLVDLSADQDDASQHKDTASIAAEVASAIQLLHARKSRRPREDGILINLHSTASALDDLSLENDRSRINSTVLPPPKPPAALFGDQEHLLLDKTEKRMVGEGGPDMDAVLEVLNSINASALPNPFSVEDSNHSTAFEVLLEVGRDEDEALLSEYGTFASLALTQHPQGALGSVMIEFFRIEALKTNELLRHLWHCFPLSPRNPQARDKAAKLASHLREQRKSLAAHTTSHAGSAQAQQVHISLMVRPLLEAIDAGLNRHMSEEKELSTRQA